MKRAGGASALLRQLGGRLLAEAGPAVGASLAGIAREQAAARVPGRHKALAGAAVDSASAVVAQLLSGGSLALDGAEVAAQVLAELDEGAFAQLESAVARARVLRLANRRR